MWTQLIRGLVENDPSRYQGAAPDLGSDEFPASTQFNPPDIRDVELYGWARHRLKVRGVEPQEADRKAFALVVFTNYKDLLQLRKSG